MSGEAEGRLNERARALARAERWADAEQLYRQLLERAHVIDFEYEDWLKGIAACYHALGRRSEAGYVHLCLRQLERGAEAFPADAQPVEAARVRELQARGAEGEMAASLYLEAGEGYALGGRQVLSAIAFAQAGDVGRERRAWQRVLGDPRLNGHAYEQALVHFNLGLAAQRDGDRAVGHRHLVQAQQLLEEVADELEGRGERERAFDCYAILLKLGKDSGSYENLAEGYINCIRVLKEDNLKFYVLQYYEDFLRISLERGELHAAASVCREAADYARRVGLVYDRGYLRRAAEIWWRAGDESVRDAGPVELAENAYLASVDAWAALGDFFHVRESYRRLAALPLGDKKRRRYEEVSARYADVWQEAIEAPPFPDYLRHQHAYPEIWYLDLVEWDLDGDPREVCAMIVGDLRYADLIRRRALGVLLVLLEARGGGHGEPGAHLLVRLAEGLGELQAYAALRPLERLAAHAVVEVRAAVMRALRHLYFKRSFTTIRRGLRDQVAAVREAALEALAALHFPHAFDPLQRIFREHEEPRIRQTALESLGRIGSLEAGEFLVEVLRYEPDPLREVARRLLLQLDNPDLLPLLERHLGTESGLAGAALAEVVAVLRTRRP